MIHPIIEIYVHLGNRCEHLKFYSEDTARYYAKQYAQCEDVELVRAINSETGELIYASDL